jgi:hypothetical protein
VSFSGKESEQYPRAVPRPLEVALALQMRLVVIDCFVIPVVSAAPSIVSDYDGELGDPIHHLIRYTPVAHGLWMPGFNANPASSGTIVFLNPGNVTSEHNEHVLYRHLASFRRLPGGEALVLGFVIMEPRIVCHLRLAVPPDSCVQARRLGAQRM